MHPAGVRHRLPKIAGAGADNRGILAGVYQTMNKETRSTALETPNRIHGFDLQREIAREDFPQSLASELRGIEKHRRSHSPRGADVGKREPMFCNDGRQ